MISKPYISLFFRITLLLMFCTSSLKVMRCARLFNLPSALRMCNTGVGQEAISSVSNGKVKLLKSLSLKKKREEYKLVPVEGQRIILDALESGATPKHILYSDSAFRSPLAARLDEAMRKISPDCFIGRATSSILDSLSDTVTSQGIYAAFSLPRENVELFRQLLLSGTKLDPLIVVLDRIRDPGNMGTLIRSCYGMGADALICIESCDIWSPKVMRAATGVQLTSGRNMPILEYENWESISELLMEYKTASTVISSTTRRAMQIVLADGKGDSIPYTKVDFSGPTLLVIGSEADGVSEQASDASGEKIRAGIPMSRQLESFNAAVAGSILLAEASRQREQF